MRRIRSHLTFANVVSVIALCVALGGSSYAAVRIGTKQIKNGAVTTKKLHKGAVTRSKLRNGSQFLSDLTFEGATTSPATSTSPQEATVTCPPGTKVLSANADLSGGKDGTSPNVVSHVTTEVYTIPDNTAHVEAYESSPFADTWFVLLNAICAKTG